MGWLQYYARQPEAALEHLRRALAMNPTSEENHRLLGLAYLQLGQYDDAAAALREAIAVSGSSALAAAGLGAVAAARGRAAEARAVIGELTEEATRRYVSPVAFAIVHAALGEIDAAFGWLDRAFDERRGWLCYLKVEPLLDSLRDDPRFLRLLEQMRLD